MNKIWKKRCFLLQNHVNVPFQYTYNEKCFIFLFSWVTMANQFDSGAELSGLASQMHALPLMWPWAKHHPPAASVSSFVKLDHTSLYHNFAALSADHCTAIKHLVPRLGKPHHCVNVSCWCYSSKGYLYNLAFLWTKMQHFLGKDTGMSIYQKQASVYQRPSLETVLDWWLKEIPGSSRKTWFIW